MIELHGMAYSPWTIKARWAFEHHRVVYRYREHLIIFGMPELIWKLRKPGSQITVPALIDGSTRLTESFEIARHAERIGKGSKLFPEKNLEEIRRIDGMANEVASAARALVLHKLADDPKAQEEYLPSFVPRVFRPLLRFLAKIGAVYISRAFRISPNERGQAENLIYDSLSFLRAMRKTAGGDYLLGEFSYADIAMCTIIQVIAPYQNDYMRARPAVNRLWTDEKLKTEFRDLVEWRDRIYAANRGP